MADGTITEARPIGSRGDAADVAEAGSIMEALGGTAAVVLAVIGLADVLPDYLLAIAVIVVGATLTVQSLLEASELSEIISRVAVGSVVKGGIESELGAETMAGGAAVVLGILSLLSIHPVVLGAIAVIVLGAGYVLGSGVIAGLGTLETRTASNQEPARSATPVAAASPLGQQVLVGASAIILGILALVGPHAAALELVALLALGASALLSGGALGGKLTSMMAVR